MSSGGKEPGAPGDAIVARLGTRAVDARQFVAEAKFLDVFEPVLEHLARRTGAVAAARREKWAPTEEELQAEADAFRRALGLHRARAMTTWLETVGFSLDEFEEEMELRVVRRKARARFSRSDLDACWKELRPELDQARISQIVVAAEGVARELVEQANVEKKDFRALAEQHSTDEATRGAGGYVGWVRRRDLAPELAARIFATPAGRCAAPVTLGEGTVVVVLVHETRPAALDARMEEELRDLLLERWLAKVSREARGETAGA